MSNIIMLLLSLKQIIWKLSLWKERLNSYGQQFHQYQQKKQKQKKPQKKQKKPPKKPVSYHLKSLNIEKTTTYDVENLLIGFRQAHKCGGFKLLYHIQQQYQNGLVVTCI